MTPSTTRRAIAHVSRTLAPRMKQSGFRRQANHFHRKTPDLIHGVNFQASRWGSAGAGKFTINLIVTSEPLYETWLGHPLPANPATALYPVQQRIGFQRPDRRDHWWLVDAETDLDALAKEVEHDLFEHGLRFFDAFMDSGAMLERLRRGEGLPGLTAPQAVVTHAVIAARMGLMEEAQERLETALRNAAGAPFGATIRVMAERLGLRLGQSL